MTSDPYNAFLHLDPQPGTGGPVVGVKDVIDVAGMPTTAASRILHRVPEQDADCVARLRAAGATIAGKLNTHEFAFGALTNSPHFGPALNPWNTGAHLRRLEWRQRRRGRRRARRRLARHRHGRLRPHPGGVLRRHRRAAVGRARLQRRRVPDRADARLRRPARPLGRGVPAASSRLLPAGRSTSRERDLRIGVVTSLFEARRSRRRRRVRGGDAGAARAARAGRDPAARGDRDDHAADHAPGGDGHAPAVAAHSARRLRRGRPGAPARGALPAAARARHRPARARAGCATSGSAPSAATTCSSRLRCRSPRRVSTRSRRTTGCWSCPTTRPRPCSACPSSSCPAASSTGSPSGLRSPAARARTGSRSALAHAFQEGTDWHLRRPD